MLELCSGYLVIWAFYGGGLPDQVRRAALANFTFRVRYTGCGFLKMNVAVYYIGLRKETVYLLMAFSSDHFFTGKRLSPHSGLSAFQAGVAARRPTGQSTRRKGCAVLR